MPKKKDKIITLSIPAEDVDFVESIKIYNIKISIERLKDVLRILKEKL